MIDITFITSFNKNAASNYNRIIASRFIEPTHQTPSFVLLNDELMTRCENLVVNQLRCHILCALKTTFEEITQSSEREIILRHGKSSGCLEMIAHAAINISGGIKSFFTPTYSAKVIRRPSDTETNEIL